MPTLRRRGTLLLAAVLFVTLMGCGTTLQNAGRLEAGAPEESLGLGQPTPSSNARTGDQGLALSTGPTSSGAESTRAPGVAGVPTQSGTDLRAKGVTATTVALGYMYSDDAQAFGDQFGAEAPSGNTERLIYKAVADDLNSRGGILGHRIEMVGFNMDTARQVANPTLAEEEMCTHFTEDRAVFAVLIQFLATATPCLSAEGVASVGVWGNGAQRTDAATLKKYLLYSPANVVLERFMPVFVDRLVAQDYFHGWDTFNGGPGSAPVKVGLFYDNSTPAYRRWAALLKQALAARGHAVDAANEFTFAGTAQWSTAADSAVLRFSSNRVTHVISPLSFEPQAENQHYRPRYAVDSNMDGMWGVANQHRGAVGVGWWPSKNLKATGNPNAPSPPVSSMQTRCQEIMTKAGITINWSSSGQTQFRALAVCDSMWSLASALQKGRAITLPALAAGFNALGTVASPLTFSETWGPDRHASTSMVADIRFDDRCQCWVYTKTRTRF